MPTFNLVNSCLLLFIPMESFQLGKFMEFCNLRHSTTATRGKQHLSLESFPLDSICTIWAVSPDFSLEFNRIRFLSVCTKVTFYRYAARRPAVLNMAEARCRRWQTLQPPLVAVGRRSLVWHLFLESLPVLMSLQSKSVHVNVLRLLYEIKLFPSFVHNRI